MSKLRVFTAIVAVSLVVPLASAGQQGKPPKPPGYTPCTLEQDVNSGASRVHTAPGCYQDNAPLCPFRVVVVDGTAVYERSGKTRTLARIAFKDGRYLLDYRPCDPATGGNCYVKLLGCYDDRDCPGGEGSVCAAS